MPATRAKIGYLATFSIGSPLVPMLEVKHIKPSQVSVPALDATHLLSPNATEEKLPGLIKPGVVEIGGNFIGDATQLGILTLGQNRTVFAWAITAPVDGSKVYTCSGTGFIASYENGPFEPSKISEFMMKLEITGTITESVA